MKPSLLDHLLEDPNDSSSERERKHLGGLARDLERLLNTRRPFFDEWARRLPDSVVAFGMADFATEDFSLEETRSAICDRIKACLKTFEPRLIVQHVYFDERASFISGARFVIRAQLADDPSAETIEIDANLQRSNHIIRVDRIR